MPTETNVDPESFQTEDMIAHILKKVEGSYKVLKGMKIEFLSLNKTITSHSISIKQLKAQMGRFLSPFKFK